MIYSQFNLNDKYYNSHFIHPPIIFDQTKINRQIAVKLQPFFIKSLNFELKQRETCQYISKIKLQIKLKSIKYTVASRVNIGIAYDSFTFLCGDVNNIMSSINQGSSESLVIAEGKADFLINSSEEKPKADDDLFDLSKDEPSLSFQIEEEHKIMQIKQICRASKDDTLVLNVVDEPPGENRKKRKDIFDKFKKEKNKQGDGNSESNLLHIFDSIFSKKPVQPVNFCGVYDHSRQYVRLNVDNATSRSRTPSAEKRARLKIFDKNKKVEMFESILPSNILNESQRFLDIMPAESKIIQSQSPPKLHANESPIKLPKRGDSLNFSSLENRFSAIEIENQDYSRDSFEINTILQSQIFREENQGQKNAQFIQNRFSKKEVDLPEEVIKNLPTPVSEQPQIQNFQKKGPLQIEGIGLQTFNREPMSIDVASPNIIKVQPQKQEVSPWFQPQQMEETKYLNNDLSSISSSPSVLVQNYQSLQGSMANYNKRIFPQVSTFKPSDLRNDSPNLLVESRVVSDNQKVIVNHVFEEEMRLPVFLRKVRKHISIYPNFYIMANTPNTTQAINQEFKLLFSQIRTAVQFLSNMCQKVLDAKSKKQLYLQEILSSLSVQSFLDSGWDQINKFDQDYELIKPFEPIDLRGWSYEKAKTALVNYENIVNYYDTKGIKLDLTSQKGKKKYFQIRHKFWDICANMKLISQDIFCEMRNCLFPSHYYEFHSLLKMNFPGRLNEKKLNYVRKLLNLYKYHKNLNDILVNSAIGDKIRDKIHLELRYLAPF